jgi:pimeloyl-ACP methyl ester carboxylesterase
LCAQVGRRDDLPLQDLAGRALGQRVDDPYLARVLIGGDLLLRQPTLILAGDDDPIIPLVNARIMHLLLTRSELTVYHGGHLDLAFEPERMAPIVEAFLDAETISAADSTGAARDVLGGQGKAGA